MRQATYCLVLFFFGFKLFSQTPLIPIEATKEKLNSTVELVKIDYLQYLKTANTHKRSAFFIELPINGKNEIFEAIKNDVYISEGKQDDTNLITFDLKTPSNAKVYGALVLSNHGLFATIFNMGKMISIYPDNLNNPDFHVVEYGIQPDFKKIKQFCGHDHSHEEMIRKPSPFNVGNRSKTSMGSKLHTYDVAIVTTGEFYFNNGNTVSAVRTAVTNTVNSISAIFKNELSFTLRTSAGLIKMYDDPGSDPFDPAGKERTQQARDVVSSNFNIANYDIGHVFHQHADGDGWGNGGVALLNSVCQNTGTPVFKAGGWSGAYSNVGNGWISLATHEFGHQFGATHTFNGIGNSCTSAIESGTDNGVPSQETAVEIGSGTTLMSYNGLCNDDQNIPSLDALDNYFHIVSLDQMYNYVYNGTGGSCASTSTSTNVLPSVVANDCNAIYRIPKNTPFYLDAKGQFTDTDTHTYCWEQIDEDGKNNFTQGKVGSAAANDARAPIFRSYPPTSVSYRYFPKLSDLASSITNPFDILPAVARELNFNVSVRDNNSVGGAVANDEIKITVENSGPFVVTRPIGGETLTAGMPEMVTWNTNGSNSLCAKIRIKLSLDGGLSYNLVLAENIDYATGSYNLTIPATFSASNSARIMLECMDYTCFKIFNISKNNFNIFSSCIAPVTAISPITPKTLLEGDPGLDLKLKNNTGKIITNISGNIRTTDTKGNLITMSGSPASCDGPSNEIREDIYFITVDVTGSYTIAHGGIFGTILNLYENEYTGSNCINFVSSSGVEFPGDMATTPTPSLTATLTAGKHYYLVVSSFSMTLPVMPFNYNITFPSKPAGSNVYDGVSIPAGYAYTYIAIDKLTNQIAFYNSTSDFQLIKAGTYCVYGVVHLITNNPDTWIGKTLFETISQSNCLTTSSNCMDLTVLPACRIDNITVGAQTPCEAATNDFTQELIITYNRPPSIGQLSVNGQLFNITTSPQSIILTGLESDGLLQDVTAFFTASTDCKLFKPNLFTAPVNCCPLSFELGQDIEKCVGESVVLDAGNDGISFIWRKNGVDLPGTTAKSLTVTTTGDYEVEVTHSSGCKKTDKIKVNFNALPTISLVDNQRFCDGETYTLNSAGSGSTSYQWYKDGSLLTGEVANSINITLGGLYKLVGKSEFGCDGEDETMVTLVAKPVVELGDYQKKCDGDTVILQGGTDGTSFVWYKDDKVINNATQSTYEVVQTGTYKVVVKNADQCQSIDEVKIDFFSRPAINDFPALINICQGESNKITAIAVGYKTLQWYYDGNPILGQTTLITEAKNSGIYAIEATNDAGCKTRKSVNIEIRSLPVVNLGDPTLVSCQGNTVELDAGGDGTKYSWSKDGTPLPQTTRMLNVTLNGIYKVTVTNQFNCNTIDEINLSFIPGPNVSLNGDATICEGESHQIIVTTNATNAEYKWFNDLGLITGETGSSILVTAAGNYRVAVKGGTPACEVTQSVKINVNPRPAFNLGNDKTLCAGDTPPVLNAGAGNTSFVWTFNGAPLATTQNVTADKSGTYEVTVKNSFNCSRTERVKITYEDKPTLEMISDSYNLCTGNTLDVTVVSTGTKFEWKRGTNVIAGQTGKTLKVTQDGTYTLIISNAANCKTEKTFTVVSRPIPVVDLGPDFSLCPGETKLINAGTHTQYLWADNTTTGSFTAVNNQIASLQTTNYKVTVTNQFGCTQKDSIKVTFYPVVKASVVADKPGVCNGEPVVITASGGLIYKWTDPAGNSLSSLTEAVVTASPTETTTYTVEVSDGICTTNVEKKTIEIQVFEPVNISAGIDTCVIEGRTIKLGASGGVTYQWDNPELIIGASNIANPEIKPIVETIFTVTITDVNGCEFTDNVSVCVKKDSFKPISIITPNGDGNNDELYFGNLSDFPENKLIIFNRWGNVIFETEGYQLNGKALFDGTRNGDRLPADTYYYVLSYGGKEVKSALTILWD